MPRVMGMLLQPVECIAGHLERELVAGHRAHGAGRIHCERRAINVLFVTEPGIEPALRIDDPVESPSLLVAHHLVEESDPMAGILDEFIMMSRRIRGQRPPRSRSCGPDRQETHSRRA